MDHPTANTECESVSHDVDCPPVEINRSLAISNGHITAPNRSIWLVVLILAWPVLIQQALVLMVQLSDRFLAGRYQVLTAVERIETAHSRFSAAAILAGNIASRQGFAGIAGASVHLRESERLLSKQAAYLSAQTTASYFTWFLYSYCILVTVGSTALVARSIGAGDGEAAIHFTNQSLLLAMILGVAGMILGLVFLDQIIWVLQLRGPSAEFARQYLQPIFLLFVFQVVELAGIACLVGAGDTRSGLWVMVGVVVINIPVSWVLCLGISPFPKLGFAGIAWGTAIAHSLGGIAVMTLLLRGRYGLKCRSRLLRPDFSRIYRMLRVSAPAAADSMSVVVCQCWYLSIVNQLGDVAGSAHGIAINWEALGFLSGMAFGTAAMTLVGQNLGAKQPDRAARGGWSAFAIGCLTMTLMGVCFYILAKPMFLLFVPYESQREIVKEGIPVLQLIAFAMPFLASAIIFTHALRGAGDTAVPVVITWTGFLLVRIPLAYWLALPAVSLGPLGPIPGWNLGLYGAWLAMFADLVLRGLLLGLRFASGAWKKITV